MNSIIIYGPGCVKCAALAEITAQAMEELHVNAPLEKVTDVMQFAVAGILVTPALAVGGRVLVSGRVPSRDELKKLLQEAFQDEASPQASDCSGIQKAAPVCEGIPEPKDAPCCNGGERSSCVQVEPSGTARGAVWKKAVVWAVVILLLLAAIKVINQQRRDEDTEQEQQPLPITSGIEAVYYKYGTRCPTCIRMETWARDAIEKNFSRQLKEGKLAFHTLTADKEAVEKYGLTTKSLIIKEWKDGKQSRWMNLDLIWELNEHEQGFKEYVIRSIRNKLAEIH